MSEINEVQVAFEPIIDSKNPPISIDNVILGENGTGSIRFIGFAGNAYVEREEQVNKDGQEIKRLWIRPVSIIDIGTNAVKFAEAYLLHRLAEDEAELRFVLDNFPEVMSKLYASLTKARESNADD